MDLQKTSFQVLARPSQGHNLSLENEKLSKMCKKKTIHQLSIGINESGLKASCVAMMHYVAKQKIAFLVHNTFRGGSF